MKRKKPVYSRFFFKFLKNTLTPWLRRRFHISYNDPDHCQDLDGPYIVCANHVNFWDPFIINEILKEPIHYIVSDSNFRTAFRRWFLNLVGSIPKTKAMSDAATIRAILEVVRQGHVIGLFPEGIRSWEGRTAAIFYSAAKLIKRMKIPVVTAVLRGAFLSRPRWAKKASIGAIEVDYSLAFSPDDLKKTSVDEIFQKLTVILAHNETEYQRKKKIAFKGKHAAEGIEYALFTCPVCGQYGTLHAHKRDVLCEHCHNHLIFNEFGFFETFEEKDKLVFDNINDWYDWQINELNRKCAEMVAKQSVKPIFSDTNARLFIGYKDRPLILRHLGEAACHIDRIEFKTKIGKKIVFEYENVRGINVQDGEKLEFYYREDLYRLDFRGRVSALKWELAVKSFQHEMNIKEPAQVTGGRSKQ